MKILSKTTYGKWNKEDKFVYRIGGHLKYYGARANLRITRTSSLFGTAQNKLETFWIVECRLVEFRGVIYTIYKLCKKNPEKFYDKKDLDVTGTSKRILEIIRLCIPNPVESIAVNLKKADEDAR